MDPVTSFVIASLMMLANGGVLGLMHRDLHPALRPAAVSWRIATLLIAGGCILFAVQRELPPAFVLPLANGLVLLGMTGYWHALRQFYGRPASPWLLLPVLLATVGVFWFVAVHDNIGLRILIVSAAWLVIMAGSVVTLRSRQHDVAASRRVLAGIFIAVMVFTVLRLAYFMAPGTAPIRTVLDTVNLMNMITPMIVSVLPVIGTTGFLLLCSERIRRQWERAASTDYLTGLANRRTLADAGTSRFVAMREAGDHMGLAVIDIDHFKSINDRFGHDVGDVALKHVAARLEAACRGGELPARQGGEEFVVLFEHVDAAQALAVGERLRQSVESQPFSADGMLLTLTVSVGVAVMRRDDGGFDDLLRRADAALYAAKEGGRNRVELAD